jgi:N,N'-diacetyllegionaminate synthase
MTLIIAEAGVNHNGDIKLAKDLIDIASNAGADIIKFQTFKAENLVTDKAKRAEYQIKNIKNSGNQYSMLKKLELTNEQFEQLKLYCDDKNIEFLSTAFDLDGLDFLVKIGIKRIKIPSGEINNLPFLAQASQYGLPIILSTGMSTLDEIKEALNIFLNEGVDKSQITILHCTTDYPTPLDSVNLLAMQTINKRMKVSVGYSDHTKNYEVPIAAVALGAQIIEKHFTKSRNLEGPDHIASLEPLELAKMILSIRNTELLLGSHKKEPTLAEIENLKIARKSIVAKKNIQKGEVLSTSNITTKRPGSGLSPMLWNELLGSKAIKDFMKDDLIIKK